MNTRSIVKSFIPPVLFSLIRKFWPGKKAIEFKGKYGSWQEAIDDAGGYDVPEILERVYIASNNVKSGKAVFERDSVCFYHEEYRWQTLACLLAIAAENVGNLRVLDFGGALGSFYFQHKKLLERINVLSWNVVEQPHFAECGRNNFQDGTIRFLNSIDECLKEGNVDIVFCSSVLQYLEKPGDILNKFIASKAKYLLIDRTAFIFADNDRLTVQYVSDSIYSASYPAWFFSWSRFQAKVKQIGYKIELEFAGDDDVGIGQFKGVLLVRN